MPNRKKRARMRRGGGGSLLAALILLFAAVAGLLVFLLIRSDPLAPGAEESLPYAYPTGLVFADADATYPPLVLGPTATPEPTGGVEVTPAPSAPAGEDAATEAGEDGAAEGDAAASEAEAANRFMPTPRPGDYFLPVLDRALRTPDDRAMIAITLDGCDDADKMTTVLNVAARYDAKLTLFPTGDALMKLGAGFRTCVNTLGYELENATYDPKKKDYALSGSELALQLGRQNVATSFAMQRDYQQHFYRSSTPQSALDQRTHFFIRKLGFLAVVSYTHSYKGNTLDELVGTLANGNIYQFDMSDESMALLEPFLSEANRKGYKLVTLNELVDVDANEQGRSYTVGSKPLENLDDYVPSFYDLKLNDRSNAVYTLQARLIGLGYLIAEPGQSLIADGIYGSATSIAVSRFQARVGLVATGNADVATQQALFSQSAPTAYETAS